MKGLQIKQVTRVIGAEISGVSLKEPLSSEDRAAIEAALLEHHVLFFRDQDITPEEQVEFARQFGEISTPPFTPKYSKSPDYIVLDQTNPEGEGADNWHSDNTFMAEPPLGSILKAVLLPKAGGDTCFANMAAAYQALSEPIRAMLDGLEAEHDITKPLQKAIDAGHSEANLSEVQAKWPPVRHPVVRKHPVTGNKALFVNGNSTTRLLEISERENQMLLPFLLDHVRSPTFQCRFRWDAHSIAFWDNRSTQHYAVPDYQERRVMHRVTLAGDRPT
jgi:taurine dioxygenase